MLEYLDLLPSSDDLDALKQDLSVTLPRLGFSHFPYAHVQPPLNTRIPDICPDGASPGRTVKMFVGTYPSDWLFHYFAREYPDADVTFQVAAGSVRPFRWDDLCENIPLSARQRRVFDDAREFGARDGVTVPIHGPERGLATLNFFTDVPHEEFDRI